MQSFFRVNKRLSHQFDRILLPQYMRTDGLKDYQSLVPAYIQKGDTVFDIGGGKIPFVSADLKKQLRLRVIGLDIDAEELRQAPKNIYDETIVQDISIYKPAEPFADIVICEAVLEHVQDVDEAMRSITMSLKPGGKLLIFLPCRNALFARINMLIPESVKKRLLYHIFPESKHGQGFPAYYDNCTPKQFQRICRDNGLEVQRVSAYFYVAYFSFFLPFHITWRFGQLILYPFFGSAISEAFTVVAYKPVSVSDTLNT